MHDAGFFGAKIYGRVGGHARSGQPHLTYPQRRSAKMCFACPKCDTRCVGPICLFELQRYFLARVPEPPLLPSPQRVFRDGTRDVAAPTTQFTAAQVARTIEYDGHVQQRGYWAALQKEWTRVVALRANWAPEPVTTYQERVAMASRGAVYSWFKRVDPWDYAACFPRVWLTARRVPTHLHAPNRHR